MNKDNNRDNGKTLYSYINRDLLKEPEYYFYSQFKGVAFVREYINSRSNYIKYLQEKVEDDKKCLEKLYSYINSNIYINKDVIITNNILLKILDILICKKYILNKEYKSILDGFIKRYEVNKKLFNSYERNFNNVDNSYENMENYIVLSLCCEFYYKQTGGLKYLNTSIKLNDLICSRIQVLKERESYLSCVSLMEEVAIINKLYEKEGIIL